MRSRALGLLFLSILGSGGGSPTDPGSILLVTGTWIETATVVSNTCEIEIPGALVATFTLVQSGASLTADYGDGITATGTIDRETGQFSLSAVLTVDGSSLVFVQGGRFTSSNAYTAESTNTISDAASSCLITTSDSGRREA